MWADTETDLDFLNYSEIAELAVDLINDQKMLPLSLGVFGGWGSGKSSLLQLIEQQILKSEGENKAIIVKFDAWLYQGFDDARAALMEVISSALMVEAKKADGEILSTVKNLVKRINFFRLAGFLADGGAALMGVPSFGAITKGVEALGKVYSGHLQENDYNALKESAADISKRSEGLLKGEKKCTPPEEIAAFRSELTEVLNKLGKTLVVFIDNLDRCLPTNAIHTLEAIRLFLFLPRTAFVIAADEEMIRHAVTEHYGNINERLITDYLDKLIQVPIRVPRLGVHEVRAYMFMLFASVNGIAGEQLETLRAGIQASLRDAWKDEPISKNQALELLNSIQNQDVIAGFDIADRIAPSLANSSRVQGNPRIVKRMLNVVRMRSKVARKRNMPIDEAIIAKIALFERCTDNRAVEELYKLINETCSGKPAIISQWENTDSSLESYWNNCPDTLKQHQAFIKEWASLQPMLSDTNLRPVLYLNRETMPLRFSREGLSPQAEEAIKILLKTQNLASPTAKKSVNKLNLNEHIPIMEFIIDELRKVSSWVGRPEGFNGAIILADLSLEAAKVFSRFINSLQLSPQPPWLKSVLNDKDWYTTGTS